MDRTAQLAGEGEPAGTVIVAGYQSRGRGTRGRAWHAPPDTCLMFSFILRPTVRPSCLERLPAHVADLLATFLRERFGIDTRVKAPNDILVGDNKLCGILCTSRIQGETVEWVVCGIGLNTTMRQSDLPIPNATSLALEGVDVPPHRELLLMVLAELQSLLEPDLAGLTPDPGGCAAEG